MGFSWGGKELLNSIFVDLQSGAENFGFGLQDIGIEVEGSKEPFEDGGEDAVEGLVFEGGEGS